MTKDLITSIKQIICGEIISGGVLVLNSEIAKANMTEKCAGITKLLKRFRALLNALLFVCLAIMVGTVFTNVVCRYTFNTSLNWVDEVSRAVFVWLVFFAIVLTMWDKDHIGLGNIIARINLKAGKIAAVLAALLKLVFIFYLFFGGTKLVSLTLVQLTPYLAFPAGYIYAAAPVASILMIIISIRDIAVVFTRQEVE